MDVVSGGETGGSDGVAVGAASGGETGGSDGVAACVASGGSVGLAGGRSLASGGSFGGTIRMRFGSRTVSFGRGCVESLAAPRLGGAVSAER